MMLCICEGYTLYFRIHLATALYEQLKDVGE